MKSIVEVVNPSPIKIKYPYIGKSKNDDSYVLFNGPMRGIVIKDTFSSIHHVLGYYSDNWLEYSFDITTDKVILEND